MHCLSGCFETLLEEFFRKQKASRWAKEKENTKVLVWKIIGFPESDLEKTTIKCKMCYTVAGCLSCYVKQGHSTTQPHISQYQSAYGIYQCHHIKSH